MSDQTQEVRAAWPLDVAWIGLLVFTGLMGYAATIEGNSVLLFGITSAKAVLISAVFMGLWRAEKRALAVLVAFFVLLAVGIVGLLP